MVLHRVIVSCLALTALPAFAASESDWFASLYTGEGTELRADERVFALYAIFNAVGFDAGPVVRKDPVPRVVYHPVRQAVRGKVIGGDPEVKKAADAFFDAHPLSLRKYLAYALAGGAPPFSVAPKEKELADLKGFEQVLARAWTGWKLDAVLGQVQGDYRKTIKTYLTAIDEPLARARKLLKVPENGPQTLLVVNLLDAQDGVLGTLVGNEVIIVVGPADKPNVEGVVREFARVFVEGAVAKKASAWAGGAAVLREAQLAGATEQSVEEYTTALLTRAVALKAFESNDAAYDAAAAKGYFGLKDVAKLFDDPKGLDGLGDALKVVETRRPAKPGR
jgi:hypothetical protein